MKKIIKMAFLAAFVLTVGYSAYSSYRTEATLSDLTLDNVEALAGEATSPCKGYGSVLCSYNNIWVYSQG